MKRSTLLWLAACALLAVIVAVQVVAGTADRSEWYVAQATEAPVPTVLPGTDILAGIALVPERIRGYDYRRAAYGEAWDDDNDAPGGHNGCDTRFLGGFGVLSETLRKVPFTPRTFR